jgi:SWI/SNF-related matrix-associated actin-dependent regulator 1 of chromatin subfamily A
MPAGAAALPPAVAPASSPTSGGAATRLWRPHSATLAAPRLALLALLVAPASQLAGASVGPPAAGGLADDYTSMRAMWLSGKAGGGGLLNAPPGAASATGAPAGPPAALKAPAAPPAKRPRISPPASAARSGPFMHPRAPDGAQARREGLQGQQTRLDGGVVQTAAHKDSARPAGQTSGGAKGGGNREPRECTITLAFVSKYRFAATSSFPPKEVSDAYKMNMGRYEPDNKRWTFPFEQYHKLAARLQQVCRSQVPGFSLRVKGIPDAIVAIVREGLDRVTPAQAHASANATAEAHVLFGKLPQYLRQNLMEFQREGVFFGLARKGRVLIGDEMGLGKTIQAIAIASAYMSDWPLLVVCPSSMRNVWAQEIVRWLPDIVSAEDINLIYTSRDPVSTCPVTIISYDLFSKLSYDIRQQGFKVVIADESHYLKNGQAKRTMAIVPAVRQAKHAILLTGTPALARPIELFNLLNCLHPTLFPNYLEYAERYCAAHQGPFGLDTGGSSNVEELHMVLQKHAMIRRLKKQVLTQLPPKRRQRIMLQMPSTEAAKFSAQIEKLKELEAQADDPAAADEERMAASSRKRNLIMKLYVDTGQAKTAAVREYVGDLLDCGAKFLVFAHHMPVLDGLEECVKQRKVKYIRIDGRTPSSERQRRVALFQQQSDVRVAVLSITAAGTGLTLTAAQTVVFAELHWTPGVLLQAEDRVHRIGQNGSSVNIHYLIAQGTCDDLIWDSISHKMRVVGRTLDGQVAHLILWLANLFFWLAVSSWCMP